MSTNDEILGTIKNHLDTDENTQDPIYKRVAEYISKEILSGRISNGQKLPTNRELANYLNLNITTITRSMGVLLDEKLIETSAGRGTRVALHHQGETQFKSSPSNDPSIIDLTVNRPSTDSFDYLLLETLSNISSDKRFSSIKDYQPAQGPLWARKAMTWWARSLGVNASINQVVLCGGAQHALTVTLSALFKPGDVIYTDSYTYQGLIAACKALDIDLIGINTDHDGISIPALTKAVKEKSPSALFITSSSQNPTTATLSLATRKKIASLADKYDFLIIEDGVYQALLDIKIEPVINLAPERTVYISSLSKCVAPGLRAGFIVSPPNFVDDISTSLRINCWCTSTLTALVTTILIESGRAGDLVVVQREELRARHAILNKYKGDCDIWTSGNSPHAWLLLPDSWTDIEFTKACISQGVALLPGSEFNLNKEGYRQGVRVNLGAAVNREQLKTALEIIVSVLQSK
ncbi:PLP-dependent aminotransferase family protein [Psychromonas aquatilis]|uniref:PLP-dependent aminotransferase family protein n=1 Tax=Psychromonas aquatilis TaxID=2005072 RepID=A0ABU9GNG8_9GAMM